MPIVPVRSRAAFAPIVAFAALVLTGCPMPGSAPEAPVDLEGTALSSTGIALSWDDMSDDEKGFRVERRLASDVSYVEVATLAANATSWTDAGLTASTAYTYRLFAYNRRGDSMASNTVSVTTTAAPPTAPTGLNATAISTSQIDLSWTDHSANETGFNVERSLTGTGGWSLIATRPVNDNYYSNTGLASGTLYYYRVYATSAVGTSGYSNVANATTLSLPAAPSGLSASAFSATQVDLAWTDNATNETGFRIDRSPNGSTGWTEIATTGANIASYHDTGLATGSAYYYRVRATNAAGDSAYSNTAGLTLSVPAAPTGLGATAFSTTQINLAWTDAANNETGYGVERSPDGSTGWTEIATVATNSTGYSNTGLVSGATWHYRVRAVNGLGYSAYSGSASATTLSLPAAPSLLTATPMSGTRIDLAWTDNATNETGFKVERRANGGAWSQIATPAANTTTYVNGTGLSAGNTYDYRIRASNAVGDSVYSGTATVVFTVPAAPSGLTATGTSTSQIGLAWADNSGNETGFDVERSLNGTSGWSLLTTTPANTAGYQNTGVPAGAKYYYRVRAKNIIVSSANSGTASVASLHTAQSFKVANSWVVGFS
ncbi:MAG: hypothetical protein QG587_2038, partial [Chloroflexota bacterium]|nr:hypothetical protein [Chloroflexota bacterium]